MEYSFGQAGGQEAVFRALAEAISREFDLVLVTSDTPESWDATKGKPPFVRHVSWQPQKITSASSRALANAFLEERVRLAHFHFGGTFSWGNRWFGRCPIHAVARKGITCLTTVHSVHPPLDGYIGAHRPLWVKLALFPLAWGAKCYTLSRTAMEFAVSRHDLETLHGCSGPFAQKQHLIYHSIVREGDLKPGTKERSRTILCVANLGYRKGQEILVEAFKLIAARFPEWRVVLVGRWQDGDRYYERVRAAINASPFSNRIDLRGGLASSEVHDLMRSAGIFCLPSLEEGLGLALQEALLCGCPSVASRVGGIPELIDEGVNGLLVAPGDAYALANALSELMGSPQQRELLGQQSRRAISRKGMTVDAMLENYLRTYRHFLSEKGT